MVKNVLNTLRKKQKNNKGFSLVELIIVIAIMAVLVGVLAPQLIKYVEKSREATDIQNCDSIVSAIKTYYSDKDNAPDNVTVYLKKDAAISESALNDAGLNNTTLKGTGWNGNMIKIVVDTKNGSAKYTCGSKYYEASGADTIKTTTTPSNITPSETTSGGGTTSESSEKNSQP